MNELASKVLKFKGLLRTLCAKKRMAMNETKRLHSLRRRVTDYFHMLHLKMPGFQSRLPTDVEIDFTEFCRRLITSISSLIAARRRGIHNAMKEAMEPPREILKALAIALADIALLTGNCSTALQ